MGKRKVQRKALKKPDEFVTFATKVGRWCAENRRTAVGAGAGLAVLLLLVGVFFLYQGHREKQAQALYAEALALYPQAGAAGGDLTAAIGKLEEVRRSFGSTEVATDALVDLGNAYFQKGEYDKAIGCFKDFLERANRENSLYSLVLQDLGASYEAKGDRPEALKVYQRLAQEGAPAYKAEAELCLGRVYEAMGDRDKAKTHYQAYLKENPGTLYGEWLQTKMNRWRLAETPKAKS